jgi:hypothetical protein
MLGASKYETRLDARIATVQENPKWMKYGGVMSRDTMLL